MELERVWVLTGMALSYKVVVGLDEPGLSLLPLSPELSPWFLA